MSVWIELAVYTQTALAPFDTHPPIDVRVLDPIVRPGADTALHGASPEVSALVEQATHAYAIRFRGDASLEDAQRTLAEVLDALAAREVASGLADSRAPHPIVVVDLFSLDARPIDQAAARMRAGGPQSHIWIALYPCASESPEFDMESFGLRKLGLRELHVPSVAKRHTELVAGFLNDVARYAAATGAHIKPGDAVSFGWVDVRQIPAEKLDGLPDTASACSPRFFRDVVGQQADELPGVLVVFEPEGDHEDAPWRPGVARAAHIMEQMLGASRQCGMDDGVDIPRAHATAVVCNRVAQGPPIEARRVVPDEAAASGWVALCTEPDHDHHDAANFDIVALKWLAASAPRLFSMLASPPGTGITVLPDGQMTIHLPDSGSGSSGGVSGGGAPLGSDS